MVGVPSSCALLDGFAIGSRVSLLCQHSAEREMSASACTRSMPGFSSTVSNGVRRINEVALRRARLVLRWVTVRGYVVLLCSQTLRPTQPPTLSGTANVPAKE